MNGSRSEGVRATSVSIALNTGLAIIKLSSGLVGNSHALVADAIESLGDIFSSAIVRAGLVIGSRPPDDNHPYGHGKAEPLAALFVSAMLLAGAATIAVHALSGIRMPHPPPRAFTLAVLLGVVAVKEAFFRYESRVAQETGSTAIAVDAWHHRSDALTSAAAAIGIGIAIFGGAGYETADDWAALAACLVIVVNGSKFARTAIHDLMDTSPATALAVSIRGAALQVEGALFVEKVIVRKVGSRFYVDLHLEVDPELTVRQGHAIAHGVKDSIMAQASNVDDVLVHLEPHQGQ